MDIVKRQPVKLNVLNMKDIHGLKSLSASVGWDYDEDELRTVLLSGKVFGYKTATNEIVSSAAVIPYDTSIASIGMVIVHQQYRGMALGRQATQACIDAVEEGRAIMLIATEEGKPLYERMGFKEAGFVQKFIAEKYAPLEKIENHSLKKVPYNIRDFEEIIELDQKAFGDSRRTFLQHRLNQARSCYVLKDNQGNIYGYGLSIFNPANLIIGPIVAPDARSAASLLDCLAREHIGKVRIDVANGNEEFIGFLYDTGFSFVNQPPVMINGSKEMPARNNQLFSIAAQAFG